MYYIITKKNIIISLIVLTIVSACTISCLVLASSSKSWGLSFSAQNEPPKGNATAEELLEHNAYFIGNTSKKEVYITFDVGYEAGNMESILDTLKANDVKGLFFITAHYLNTSSDIVKRMIDEGHTVRKPYGKSL